MDAQSKVDSLLDKTRFEPEAGFRRRRPALGADALAEAAADPDAWWARQAELLDWFEPWSTVLDDSDPPFYRWFDGGRLNASHNCLDRHVAAGLGARVAYHWRGEDGSERDVTYAELLADTQRFANVLKGLGVEKGDVVGIYLPMIPEVAVAMLACARIGAVHNLVFGGFSAASVRERMESSAAKVLVTVDSARRKGRVAPVKQEVDAAMDGLAGLERIVVIRHAGGECPMRDGRDGFYEEAMDAAATECAPEPMEAEDPLFILYTSGSTAKPKGIVHTTGGYLTQVAATHREVFDIDPENDVYWCAADIGWITGHSYSVYGPLANAMTGVMWEGAPDFPHKGIWWELIERYGVTQLYASPTAIRTFIKWGADIPAGFDLGSLRLLAAAGEPFNPKAWLWYHEVIGGGRCPVIDTWWQTETGAIMITALPGVDATKPGSATLPFPGIAAEVVGEDAEQAGEDEGLLVVERPWPSMLRGIYQDDERFVETYFARFGAKTYLAGDAARRDADGYFWLTGRIDDVLNVSGHRLSTAELESALVSHPMVAEAAAIGQFDEQTGEAICAFVTVTQGADGGPELEAELLAQIAARIGKFARPKRIVWAEDLPKTRSGKIMRRLLRDIAEGRQLGDVTTLVDPAVMASLQEAIGED